MNTSSQKIIPYLWFDGQAEEAAKFYTSVFRNTNMGYITHYVEAGQEIHGQEPGAVMTVGFQIEGYKMVGLNGGPQFRPNPSISFFVDRKTNEEMDMLWEKLIDGGTALMPLDAYDFSEYYGWVQDKYGVSWQLMLWEGEGAVPPAMPSMLFVGENAGKADEAIDFYVSIFHKSKRESTYHYGEDSEAPNKPDHIAYADFLLAGQKFAAMDSAMEHGFSFNEAISLLVQCDSQDEVDYLWEKLSEVPEAEQCGWLKDKYGVSWQIVPKQLYALLNAQDKNSAERVAESLMQMKKIDINQLQKVAEGDEES